MNPRFECNHMTNRRVAHRVRLGIVALLLAVPIQYGSATPTEASKSAADTARTLAVYDLDRLLPRPDPEQEESTADVPDVDVLLQIAADGSAKTGADRSIGRPARMIADLTRAIAARTDPAVECDPVGRTLVVRATEAGQAAARSAIAGMRHASNEHAVHITGKMVRYLPTVREVLPKAGLPSVDSGTREIGASILDADAIASLFLQRTDRISQTELNMTSRGFERWVTAAENIYHYVNDYEVHELIDGEIVAAPVVDSLTDGVKVEIIALASIDEASGEATMLLDVMLGISKLKRPVMTFTTNLQREGWEEQVTIHLPELSQSSSRATVLLAPGQTVAIGPGRIPSSARPPPPKGSPAADTVSMSSKAPSIEEVLVVVLTAEIVDR